MQRQPKCANCGHSQGKHTLAAVHPCTVKVFAGWAYRGRVRIAKMAWCSCRKYKPEESE